MSSPIRHLALWVGQHQQEVGQQVVLLHQVGFPRQVECPCQAELRCQVEYPYQVEAQHRVVVGYQQDRTRRRCRLRPDPPEEC